MKHSHYLYKLGKGGERLSGAEAGRGWGWESRKESKKPDFLVCNIA